MTVLVQPPGGQVDLNAIPTAFIDRIDVVQATGASVYGSDAISGVINIILKDKYEGVEADAQYGNSSRHDYPDYRVRLSVGHDFFDGRLNLAMNFEWNKTAALDYTQRPWSAAQYTFAANPLNTSSSDGIPSQIVITPRTIPELTQGGLIYKSNSISLSQLVTIPDPAHPGQTVKAQLTSGSLLAPYDPGTFYQASVAAGGQGLSLAPLTSLETPLDRKLVTLIGRWEISPHVRLHGQAFFTGYDSTEPTNQPIYNSGLFGGVSGNLAFNINNPFLPSATVAALQAAAPGQQTFYLARGSTDLVGRNAVVSQTKSYDLALNLEGDFRTWDRNFRWNVAVSQGRTWGFFDQPSINQTKFAYAFNAVKDGSGNIVCAVSLTNSTDPLAQGCKPLNLFGYNASSQAAKDYIFADFRDDLVLLQRDVEANFGGDVWKLPAGPWSFNAGAEYRWEQSKFLPNDNALNGVGRSVAIAKVIGKYDTKEVYLETRIPVFGGSFSLPYGFRSGELNASYRWVDNSLTGKDVAWTYGGSLEVYKGVSLRASRSQTFRAPAITELFLPTSSLFSTATDPCDKSNISSGPSPSTRTANCQAAFQALGLPANYQLTSNVQVATVQGTTGGNPQLRNEIGHSWTYGIVLSPRFIPNLTVSADYVHIDLTGAISSFTLSQILQTCYDGPAGGPACSRFTRDNQGQITAFQSGFVNAGYTRFAGVSVVINYETDVNQVPLFKQLENAGPHRGHTAHVPDPPPAESVLGAGADLADTEGTVGIPRWNDELDVRYAVGKFHGSWTMHYLSSSLYNRTFTIENRYPLSVGNYYTHDFNVSYDITPRIQARAGINNITDSAPPYPTVSPSVYDEIGRFGFVGLKVRY
ncbi:TonB-dependent receptor domain-containing protein [Caulobacter sp. KR2-114]|uniref:TonB-dependent receptor domain-containing protein n=1 Tax=Caulobacter sp. KR2-114 TaxID=3400912 RepID=UPI003C031FFF